MKRNISIPNSSLKSRQVKLYVQYGNTKHLKATMPSFQAAMDAVAKDVYKIGNAGTYVIQEK
jgi:hypothetical protein